MKKVKYYYNAFYGNYTYIAYQNGVSLDTVLAQYGVDKDKIRDIIRVHYGDMDKKLVDAAIKAFYDIRHMRGIMKKPSTSELLDWIQALQISGISVKEIEEHIPYIGVLLKKNQDIDTVKVYRNVY